MRWMLMPLRRYADFQGRSRRMEYWMWYLFNVVITLPFTIFTLISMFSALGSLAQRASNGEFDDYVAQYGSAAYTFPYGSQIYAAPEWVVFQTMLAGAAIPLILLTIYSLVVFIPNLAVTIRRLHDTDKSGWFIFIGLIPLVGGIILLVFFFIEGTRGPNRFGPDPKGGYNPPYR